MQSALIVDGDNIYSERLCQRRALQRTLQEDLANGIEFCKKEEDSTIYI